MYTVRVYNVANNFYYSVSLCLFFMVSWYRGKITRSDIVYNTNQQLLGMNKKIPTLSVLSTTYARCAIKTYNMKDRSTLNLKTDYILKVCCFEELNVAQVPT